jgi:hypothetical protein
MEPSRSGVGLSYEIQIQHAFDKLSQYNDFVNKLQSLLFNFFFYILTIFTKSNSHITTISNALNLSKTSCVVLGTSIAPKFQKNTVNNGTDIAKKNVII